MFTRAKQPSYPRIALNRRGRRSGWALLLGVGLALGLLLCHTRDSRAINNQPAAMAVGSFTAQVQPGGSVLAEWETLMEVNTVGFNLHRRSLPDGAFEQVNPALILAQNVGGVSGARYELADAGVAPGHSYEYRLDEVLASGTVPSGWAQVQVPLPQAIQTVQGYIPLVCR
jgi:hypothetical protein